VAIKFGFSTSPRVWNSPLLLRDHANLYEVHIEIRYAARLPCLLDLLLGKLRADVSPAYPQLKGLLRVHGILRAVKTCIGFR
jgi:hypothetical protein